jgi:signal transduction histidine kinase
MGRAIQPGPVLDEESEELCEEGRKRDDPEPLIASLRIALDEADAAKRAKTAFLASVSHELRTPLNAILGFAEMISNEVFGSIDPRYADSARRSKVAASRCFERASASKKRSKKY